MGRKGPCFHCGIRHTPLWRNGPPEKPVLCNACGSRWRIWRTLEGYTPKHASTPAATRNKGIRSRQEAALDDDANDESGSGVSVSAIPFSDNYIQPENINETETSGLAEHSFWNSHVPRRKRSVLEQYVLSPVGRLHRQLYDSLLESELSEQSSEQEDILIFQKSQISSTEIGLGCLLLKSTASSREDGLGKDFFTEKEFFPGLPDPDGCKKRERGGYLAGVVSVVCHEDSKKKDIGSKRREVIRSQVK